MNRLIDADALEEGKFHSIENWTPIESASWQRGWNDAIDAIIDYAPTVDAVEVVRCKDCTMWGTIVMSKDADGEFTGGDCLNLGLLTSPTFYCAWGDKKNE